MVGWMDGWMYMYIDKYIYRDNIYIYRVHVHVCVCVCVCV